MAVKIRLARRGRRKQPYYHIIVADARSPRDGKFIEQIGSYNPMTRPATITLDRDKAFEWLMKGAQPTETARAILRFKGIMYKKHLQRGVAKGALTQEQADELLAAHIETKESKVAERFEQSKKEREEFLKRVSGSPKKQYVEEVAATEALKDFQETAREAASEAEAKTEAPAEEAAPEAEAKTEAPVEEAAPEAEAKTEAPVEETAPEAEAKTEEVAPDTSSEEE